MSSSSEWTSCTDSDDSYSDDKKRDEELAIEAKRALAYLQTKRNYRYVEFLAQGGYGWVSLVYDDVNKRSLAIKCTTDTTEMELSWWPKLNHPNILPLLEYITLDSCTVFIMPAMKKDIWMIATEGRFYEEELSFGLCRIWLRDLATALDYLHSQFLCHLDLKLDNVFLKPDGYVCLGDFSLLSDIREVPVGFHFLEVYEPPEYTQWCHGVPPEVIASGTRFGGDKADMWQYGIVAVDLLSNLKLSSSKSTDFTMFHHDVWPVMQKILLHEEYMDYILEETFVNVVFTKEDLHHCHEFVRSFLVLDPDKRMSAEEAKNHPFVNVEWPQLPREFTLPKIVVEHRTEPLPLPKEEMKDPNLTVDEVLSLAELKESTESAAEAPDHFDAMKRKVKRMQKEKRVRRDTIFEEAGKNLLEVRPAPSGLAAAKPTPWRKIGASKAEKKSDNEEDSVIAEKKVTNPSVKKGEGKTQVVKPALKKTSAKNKSEDDKKKKSK